MRTVWAFGDSYAQYIGGDSPLKHGWINQIVTNLNCDIKSFGLHGTSLHYTYHNFINFRNEFKENDIIIICLTSLYRKWFFYDKPSIAFLSSNPPSSDLSLEESNALKQYFKYLNYNDECIERINLYNFLNTVQRISEIKNIRTIIISAFVECEDIANTYKNEFPNIHFANGNLSYDVSFEEFKFFNPNDISTIMHAISNDKRFCHMIRSNHTVLANKVLDYINHGIYIDLKSGFVKKQIDSVTVQDQNFIVNELFNHPWNL